MTITTTTMTITTTVTTITTTRFLVVTGVAEGEDLRERYNFCKT